VPFSGFDGSTRVNDFYEYSFERESWGLVGIGAGGAAPPSPRHSHGAVVHGSCMYIFGGYGALPRTHMFDEAWMCDCLIGIRWVLQE
jgi:leucine-zipper-like transcriptional regulator 1